MNNPEFTWREPPAFAAGTLTFTRDADGHRRASARIADKYFSRDGAVRDPEATLRQQAEDVAALERALDHVKRGIGAGAKGQAARLALATIEGVLTRDYGLYGKIKPDNR